MPWTTTQIPDLAGKEAVVTGANSGIGLETARALAEAGASVTLAVRNLDRGAEAYARYAVDPSWINLTRLMGGVIAGNFRRKDL